MHSASGSGSSRRRPMAFRSGSGGDDSDRHGNRVMADSDVPPNQPNLPRTQRQAEEWFIEELESMIDFRRVLEAQLNAGGSNDQQWRILSAKMRERGFDWPPSMCAEKWGEMVADYYKLKRESGADWSASASYLEMIDLFTRRMRAPPQRELRNPEFASAWPVNTTGNEQPEANSGRGLNPELDLFEQSLNPLQKLLGTTETSDALAANRASAGHLRDNLAPYVGTELPESNSGRGLNPELDLFEWSLNPAENLLGTNETNDALAANGASAGHLIDNLAPYVGNEQPEGNSGSGLNPELDLFVWSLNPAENQLGANETTDALAGHLIGGQPNLRLNQPTSGGQPNVRLNRPISGGQPDLRLNRPTERVITVRWGDYFKLIGIDGSSEEIKEVIRSAFGLRTRRSFWLEDDNGIVRTIDQTMPLKIYTLKLDEGLTIKVYLNHAANESAYEVTFYAEEEFLEFLQRYGFIALTDLSCRKKVHSIEDLHPSGVYQGYRARAN